MKRIAEQNIFIRNGRTVRVTTYDDGSIEEVPEALATALNCEEWARKSGGPIGLGDDGKLENEDDIQALRNFLYRNRK